MSVNFSYKRTVHSYGVSRAMLVQNLKEEISRKQNLHQFKLKLGQAELLDKKPVIKFLFTTFALCYDNKEALVEINDFTFGVTVVNPEDQKLFTEKARPEMTVGKLSQIISRKLSSTRGKCTVKKNAKEVPDGDLLKTHIGVKTFTVNMQDMRVNIQYGYINYVMIARSDMTILELKRLCARKIGIAVELIGFYFQGRSLKERDIFNENSEMTLGSCEIWDGCIIILFLTLLCQGCPRHASNHHV